MTVNTRFLFCSRLLARPFVTKYTKILAAIDPQNDRPSVYYQAQLDFPSFFFVLNVVLLFSFEIVVDVSSLSNHLFDILVAF